MNLSEKEIEKTKPAADAAVKNNYLEELAKKYGIPHPKDGSAEERTEE